MNSIELMDIKNWDCKRLEIEMAWLRKQLDQMQKEYAHKLGDAAYEKLQRELYEMNLAMFKDFIHDNAEMESDFSADVHELLKWIEDKR